MFGVVAPELALELDLEGELLPVSNPEDRRNDGMRGRRLCNAEGSIE